MILEIKDKIDKELPFLYDYVFFNKKHYLIPYDKNVDTSCIKEFIIKQIDTEDGYYFTSKLFQKKETSIKIDNIDIFKDGPLVIAGPCSIDTYENLEAIAKYLVSKNIKFLRAGAFKPRTNPFSFKGHEDQAMDYLKKIKDKYGLYLVVELTSIALIEKYKDDVDIIQIGARNMHNYELLKAAGKSKKPILLKRGYQAKLSEFIGAAETILAQDNPNVILCERGIRNFEQSYRNVLDINAIIYLKEKSHLPIIVDPSHATGHDWMVEKACLAGLVAGADGLIVELHTNKEDALSDKEQTLNKKQFNHLLESIDKLKNL